MRTPASMCTPRSMMPVWLFVGVGGTTLAVITVFIVLIFPWPQLGRVVETQELPVARFADTASFPAWLPWRAFAVDADGDAWIIGDDVARIDPEAVEATIRRWRAESDTDARWRTTGL